MKLFYLLILIGMASAYLSEIGNTGSMRPYMDSGVLYEFDENYNPDNIIVGDVITFGLPYWYIDKYKTKSNETEIARNMALGLPTKKETNYWDIFKGDIVHAVIWRNETHFRTWGINNEKEDPYLLSFEENYKEFVVLDNKTRDEIREHVEKKED